MAEAGADLSEPLAAGVGAPRLLSPSQPRRQGGQGGFRGGQGSEEERLQELRRRSRAQRAAWRSAEERVAAERWKLAEEWKQRRDMEKAARKQEVTQRLAELERQSAKRHALEWQATQEAAVAAAQAAQTEALASAGPAQQQRPKSAATDHSEASWVDPAEAYREEEAAPPLSARARSGRRLRGGREDDEEDSLVHHASRGTHRTTSGDDRWIRKRHASTDEGAMVFRSPAMFASLIAAVESGGRPFRLPLPPPLVEEKGPGDGEDSEKECSSAGGTFQNTVRRRRLKMMHSIAAEVLSARRSISGPASGHSSIGTPRSKAQSARLPR